MVNYATRSQAANHAIKNAVPCFRTRRDPLDRTKWIFNTMSGPSAGPEAKEWAKGKDYVAWVETAFRDEGRVPGYDSVLVVTCTLDEIPTEDIEHVKEQGWKIDPITPSLFEKTRRLNTFK